MENHYFDIPSPSSTHYVLVRSDIFLSFIQRDSGHLRCRIIQWQRPEWDPPIIVVDHSIHEYQLRQSGKSFIMMYTGELRIPCDSMISIWVCRLRRGKLWEDELFPWRSFLFSAYTVPLFIDNWSFNAVSLPLAPPMWSVMLIWENWRIIILMRSIDFFIIRPTYFELFTINTSFRLIFLWIYWCLLSSPFSCTFDISELVDSTRHFPFSGIERLNFEHYIYESCIYAASMPFFRKFIYPSYESGHTCFYGDVKLFPFGGRKRILFIARRVVRICFFARLLPILDTTHRLPYFPIQRSSFISSSQLLDVLSLTRAMLLERRFVSVHW